MRTNAVRIIKKKVDNLWAIMVDFFTWEALGEFQGYPERFVPGKQFIHEFIDNCNNGRFTRRPDLEQRIPLTPIARDHASKLEIYTYLHQQLILIHLEPDHVEEVVANANVAVNTFLARLMQHCLPQPECGAIERIPECDDFYVDFNWGETTVTMARSAPIYRLRAGGNGNNEETHSFDNFGELLVHLRRLLTLPSEEGMEGEEGESDPCGYEDYQFIILYEDPTKYMIIDSIGRHGQIYDSMGLSVCSSDGSSPDLFNEGDTLQTIMSNMLEFYDYHVGLG